MPNRVNHGLQVGFSAPLCALLLHGDGNTCIHASKQGGDTAIGIAHNFVVLRAGCSIQDELFASFEQLLDLAKKRGSTYDR